MKKSVAKLAKLMCAVQPPPIKKEALLAADYWLCRLYMRDFRPMRMPIEVAATLSLLVERAEQRRCKAGAAK